MVTIQQGLRSERIEVPVAINHVWSKDFIHGQFVGGHSFRPFNVIDDFSREGLRIEVALSLPSAGVIRSLEQIIEWCGKPRLIRCDSGRKLHQRRLADLG